MAMLESGLVDVNLSPSLPSKPSLAVASCCSCHVIYKFGIASLKEPVEEKIDVSGVLTDGEGVLEHRYSVSQWRSSIA